MLNFRRRLATLAIAALLASCCFLPLCADAQVEAQTDSNQAAFGKDTWHVSASPYLWMAGLNGNLTLAGHEAAVHQSFSDIFSNLKFGVMGLSEVRRGQIGVLTDLLFVRVGDQHAVAVPQLPFPVNVTITTNTFTLTPELAYRIYSQKYISADLLGGLRYYHLGANSNFDAGPLGQLQYSGSSNWADVVGGARFLLRPTPKIGAFLIGDAGGGGSSPTWQIVYGAGYRVTKRTTAQIGYRRLYFNRQGGVSTSLEATQQGLVLGTTIRLR
jgi:hypothetical protein